VTPDGKRLVITNVNASGAGPNPCGGLTPLTTCAGVDRDTQYTASMIKGSVQLVDVPGAGRLRDYTNQVVRNNQLRARRKPKPRGAQQIRHVIYVIRENRTYDQVFGDLPKGNGDPQLDLFKDDSAPNARALAQRFAIFDNFYADAEVSADGHNWITEANATDYVDKTYPINYSPSTRSSQRSYDFEDVATELQFPSEPLRGDPTVPRSAAAPTAGYLWDNAFNHVVSFRDYGEYTATDCKGDGNVSHTTHLDDTRFGDHVDERYPGYSTSCSDHVLREPEWEREFREYERNGDLPALELVRLGNDHTNGTRAGSATPQSYVADNDLAVGRPPMAITDARANRMWGAFVDKPNLTPYDAVTPKVVPFGEPGAPTNPANAPMAAQAAKWNLKVADATPEIALNQAIWKSVKGRHATMPAPKHGRIIGSRPNDEEPEEDDG
jgi:hypothetical protein